MLAVGDTRLHGGIPVVVTTVTPDPEGSFVEVQKPDGAFVHTTEEHLTSMQSADAGEAIALPSLEEAERALRLRLCALVSLHSQ